MHREEFIPLDQLLASSEVLFLGCPHEEYREISIQPHQRLYDCWGFFESPKLAIQGARSDRSSLEEESRRGARSPIPSC